MAKDLNYYQSKLQELQKKSNNNLQKFIGQAFEMVAEANDLAQRQEEINEVIKSIPKEEIKTEPIKE